MNSSKLACTLLASVWLCSCASIVSDDDTTTMIETEPEKALCDLNGRAFDRSVHTPASVVLPSKAAPVELTCKADKYLPSSVILDTSMDGWILGNIILGGVIGVAVDLVRGAGFKYPEHVKLILDPESFAFEQARDEWYEHRVVDLNKRFDDAAATLKSQCESSGISQTCDDDIKKLENKRDTELLNLEKRRDTAKIR